MFFFKSIKEPLLHDRMTGARIVFVNLIKSDM